MEQEAIRFKDYLKDYMEFYHITTKEFANRVGISQKHLIDILMGIADISLDVASKIALVTEIPVDYILKVELDYKMTNEIKQYLRENNISLSQFLNRFHYQYLIEHHFIDFIDTDDKLQLVKDILKFLRVSTPEKVYAIDEGALYKSKNHKPELLLLWLEKCYREAIKQEVGEYKKENVVILVNYIRKCALEGVFDEAELMKEFNQKGIFLVIQDDIPSSKIRGAFKVHRGIPAIYLTRKYHRIADIYFALLHELAHLKTDYNRAQARSLVSIEDAIDEIEKRADQQAFEWMVNEDYYQKTCFSKEYQLTKECFYPQAFVAYRLGLDGKIKFNSKEYQKYNKVIES